MVWLKKRNIFAVVQYPASVLVSCLVSRRVITWWGQRVCLADMSTRKERPRPRHDCHQVNSTAMSCDSSPLLPITIFYGARHQSNPQANEDCDPAQDIFASSCNIKETAVANAHRASRFRRRTPLASCPWQRRVMPPLQSRRPVPTESRVKTIICTCLSFTLDNLISAEAANILPRHISILPRTAPRSAAGYR